MMSEVGPVDGSWVLTVNVTDLNKEQTLRVKGDLHVGGVMLKLVDALDIAMDWSDHALWWPERNLWLVRTRSTLDQYGVQADARLLFTPMHKNIQLQLPDLQTLPEMRLNFSRNVFANVIHICKELGIRHPEELSLSRKLEREDLKKNRGVSATRKQRVIPNNSLNNSNGGTNLHNLSSNSNNSFDTSFQNSPLRNTPHTPSGTLRRSPYSSPSSPYSYGTLNPNSPYTGMYNNGTLSPGSMHSLSFDGALDASLANSPVTPTRDALNMIHKPKSYAEKARINGGWLDSSRSLMEQDIQESDILLLRFKYYTFYDLNPKCDLIRINQLYEQAKWSLISEEIDCTEEEMMLFAALQFQVQQQSSIPQPDLNDTNHNDEDDIDAALTELVVTLEGSSLNCHGDITRIPELQDYLRFFKPKKFAFKSYKRYYFKFKDTHISMYRSHNECNGSAVMRIDLKGCEVQPDVNISSEKYNIKLFISTSEGMSEIWLRSDNEAQYSQWMAACRLASKGRTMADSSYDSEVSSISTFLSMQHPPIINPSSPSINQDQAQIQPLDFVAPRFIKKLKTKQIASHILQAHSNVQDMTLLEAKMNYIKAWQALPEYGITHFIVRFKDGKKEELLGIASNKLIRMELSSGDSLKTWRYSDMQTWSVNWEIKQVQVTFEQERVAFFCLTADCKVVHEYIGGYIFLSTRSADKNQTLDEAMFHKLTSGWD